MKHDVDTKLLLALAEQFAEAQKLAKAARAVIEVTAAQSNTLTATARAELLKQATLHVDRLINRLGANRNAIRASVNKAAEVSAPRRPNDRPHLQIATAPPAESSPGNVIPVEHQEGT